MAVSVLCFLVFIPVSLCAGGSSALYCFFAEIFLKLFLLGLSLHQPFSWVFCVCYSEKTIFWHHFDGTFSGRFIWWVFSMHFFSSGVPRHYFKGAYSVQFSAYFSPRKVWPECSSCADWQGIFHAGFLLGFFPCTRLMRFFRCVVSGGIFSDYCLAAISTYLFLKRFSMDYSACVLSMRCFPVVFFVFRSARAFFKW